MNSVHWSGTTGTPGYHAEVSAATRPPLQREAIVEEARQVILTDGLEALSMRHLAGKLGVRYLNWLAEGEDRIRVMGIAPSWTSGRDFPAPEGKTFRELYSENRS